jgi:hypothetical protein
VTLRLAATAVGHWEEFDGYAVAHNMPPLEELPLERFCSFVWWRLLENRDAQEVAKLRAMLWRPPANPREARAALEDKRSPWNPENENKGLGALKAQLGLKTTEVQ